MLKIDHLRLRLPPHLAGRAEAIGPHLGTALAALPPRPAGRPLDIARLDLPPLELSPRLDDRTMAEALASHLLAHIPTTPREDHR